MESLQAKTARLLGYVSMGQSINGSPEVAYRYARNPEGNYVSLSSTSDGDPLDTKAVREDMKRRYGIITGENS
jgi:hypothetical protein